MRTLTILALALATLALPGAALAAADVHLEAQGAFDAHASIDADTPSAPAAPATPPLPIAGESAPAPESVLRLASVNTGAATPDGAITVGANTDASSSSRAQPSPGEAIAHAVVPVVEKAGGPAVATVGAIALLQALGVWRFLALGAMGLYSRITKSDLLDNEHRDRVYKLIQEKPGLGVTEIAALSGLGWGTTIYHLDRLERVGFIAPEKGGLHKCYFPVGTIARETRKGIGALKADTTRNVAELLLARPGLTQTELCETLGLSPSAASKQVSKLETAGLVRRERDWKTVHLHPTESLPALLGSSAPAPALAPTPALVAA